MDAHIALLIIVYVDQDLAFYLFGIEIDDMF